MGVSLLVWRVNFNFQPIRAKPSLLSQGISINGLILRLCSSIQIHTLFALTRPSSRTVFLYIMERHEREAFFPRHVICREETDYLTQTVRAVCGIEK